MNLPATVVRKAIKKKHTVFFETLENLPQLLDRPHAIFKTLNEGCELVAVVDAKDKEDNQVIAILRPTESGINIIPSIYGKENFDNFMQRNINEGTVKAASKKWVAKNIRLQELQLPKWDIVDDLDILSPNPAEKSSEI
jgi:hypothetical protein